NQFDLAIPGGGVGIFNACTDEWNAPSSGWGAQYGGISTNTCSAFPKALQPGCGFRFDWFENADNPEMEFERVECPAAITAKSGCKRADDGSQAYPSIVSAAAASSSSPVAAASSSSAAQKVDAASSSSEAAPVASSSAAAVSSASPAVESSVAAYSSAAPVESSAAAYTSAASVESSSSSATAAEATSAAAPASSASSDDANCNVQYVYEYDL
ncbi:hypothetical protein KCU82_g8694, partial [Aureobasidium melanogenum]